MGPGDATSTITCNLSSNNVESYRITYAIPVWGPFVSADLQKITAFLKRSWRYGFTTSICDVQALVDSAMHDLFVKIQDPDHCLHQLLPPVRSTTNS